MGSGGKGGGGAPKPDGGGMAPAGAAACGGVSPAGATATGGTCLESASHNPNGGPVRTCGGGARRSAAKASWGRISNNDNGDINIGAQ